jgi:hypothetical protein
MPTEIFSNLVTYADYSILGFSVFSVGLVGQSLIARLRNEWVANHKSHKASQPALSEQVEYGWFRKVSAITNTAVNQDSAPTTPEVESYHHSSVNQAPVEDPWQTPNVSACFLPSMRCETVRHYEPLKLLQPAAMSEVESSHLEGAHSPSETAKTPNTNGNGKDAPPTEEYSMQQTIKTLQKHAREHKIPYYKKYKKRELVDTLNGKVVNYN